MGLFYEYRHQTTTGTIPVYTLKDTDWKDCSSMYLIYMEEESEYEAAMKLLGSWAHWNKLCKCTWFKPYLEAWRDERDIKEAAIGKKTLIEAALDGNVTAAKELVNKVIKPKKMGRPTKKGELDNQNKMKAIDRKVVSLLERAGRV